MGWPATARSLALVEIKHPHAADPTPTPLPYTHTPGTLCSAAQTELEAARLDAVQMEIDNRDLMALVSEVQQQRDEVTGVGGAHVSGWCERTCVGVWGGGGGGSGRASWRCSKLAVPQVVAAVARRGECSGQTVSCKESVPLRHTHLQPPTRRGRAARRASSSCAS